MASKSVARRRPIYSRRRYWYHVSTTLKLKKLKLIPWDDSNPKAFNRSGDEPRGARICVAPTIEQCMTAVPYDLYAEYNIYRTKSRVIAKRSKEVYDSTITQEGWIEKPTVFVRIATLNFEKIAKKLKIEHVVKEGATSSCLKTQRNVLKWWRGINLSRFLKSA